MVTEHTIEHLKDMGDAISIGTVIGTIIGILPAIASLLTIIWSLIRIYESDTIQKWLNKK